MTKSGKRIVSIVSIVFKKSLLSLKKFVLFELFVFRKNRYYY